MRLLGLDPQQVGAVLQRGDAVEHAAVFAGAGTELIEVAGKPLRTHHLAVLVDDDVAIPGVGGSHFFAVQEAVVLIAEVAGLVAHGDLLRQAGTQRVGAGHDDAVFDAQFEEGVAAGTNFRQEHLVRDGHLAVLVAALLFVGDLIFDLQRARTCFNHLLCEQIGRLRITKTSVDVGDDGHDMRLEAVDLFDQCLFLRLVAGLASGVEGAEDIVELTGVRLTEEGVELFDQRRHRGLLVHRLIRKRSELGAKRGDHPAGEIQIAAIGLAEMLLDRNQLLLRDEAMPATERLGVLGGIGVIGSHIAAHQRRGVPGDVQAGLETVLQAHPRHGFGGDAVPGRLGLEERLGSSKLARIGSRSLDSLVANTAWLVIHVLDPSLFCRIDIRDSALRNVLRAKRPNAYYVQGA